MEVSNVSSVNTLSRDQLLVLDLGAEMLIDRVYLFLDSAAPLTVVGRESRGGEAKWHVSLTAPHAMLSPLNPRATILDERHRLPNQAAACVPCDAQFGLSVAPRTSLADCKCLNLAANVYFDARSGCQVPVQPVPGVPLFSISGGVVASQQFSLDFLFGQPAAWSLQAIDHVLGARDFMQVTVRDESDGRVTRVKYRLLSPPFTTTTLALPNLVRTNLTVTAEWHRPGHVLSASTERQVHVVRSARTDLPYLAINCCRKCPRSSLGPK